MRYLYIRHNASIMAMSIICPPEGPLDTVLATSRQRRSRRRLAATYTQSRAEVATTCQSQLLVNAGCSPERKAIFELCIRLRQLRLAVAGILREGMRDHSSMRSLAANSAEAIADSSYFNKNFAYYVPEPKVSFQEMVEYVEEEMNDIQHMLSDAASKTKFNAQGVGAGLTLVGILLAVLIYVAYARMQGDKKSWVNSNVDLDGDHTPRYVLVIELVMYCLCSSLLLVINKVTITYIPLPGFVLFAQLAASVCFVKGMERTAGVEVDKLESKKIIPFIPVVMGFVLMLYTTMKALQFVPVDTFICARASIPAVIAIVEFFFLGRALPSARSWCALGGLVLGVFMYVKFDYNFASEGYMWIGIWYSVCVAEMVVVKHVCSTVQMTTWGRSFYMNVLALVPIIILGLLNGELGSWGTIKWTPGAIGVLLLSCLAGVGMSYYSFSLRAMISATSFSLVGNLCKVITILVNIVIWDKHAGMEGTLALLLCLAASGFYQQAPLRNPKHAAAS